MALAGPIGKETLDLSFRLHSKTQVFDGSSSTLSNAKLNLCASASSFGLVFVGSSLPEIVAVCMKDLESPTIDSNTPVRKIPMPSAVTQLATNCDGSILAVDVKVNGVPHIQLYSVASFLSPNVQKLREFQVSNDNTSSLQLCWNPVINSVLAVCTENGGLYLYLLKDRGIDLYSIDPSLKAQCCCWSPKGKQIVAGFAYGKLMQFNMELKPARTIECPPGIINGSFDTIAIQWLSTYQFAVALLSHAEESRPVLHVVNAPKTGPLQFIAYSDVCYSTSESRPSKIYLQYIQQWGMLLIASANCVDVSFLRINKPGDIPEWIQDFPSDQFPAELPLTPDKEESFPVGFELDTACSGRLLQEDGNSRFPVMPMIHLISSYGILCSFYLVNTTPTYVDICSPPRPIDPRIQSLFTVNTVQRVPESVTQPKEEPKPSPKSISAAPVGHLTPENSQKPNIFGSTAFGTSSVSQSSIGQSNAFSGFTLPPTTASSNQQQIQQKPMAQATAMQQPFQIKPNVTVPASTSTTAANLSNQPLISIPPSYNSPASQLKSDSKENSSGGDKKIDAEDEQVYVKMIHDEIKAFELELNFIMEKSRSLKVNIGTREESAEMRRQLEELDDLKKEATETVDSLRSDVQTNRLVLTEMFSMVYEAKAKCDQANNEKSIIMTPTYDRTSKRTLEKLKKMITQCEIQVQVGVQLLNSQWANYQDTLSKNKKNKMHIPSLEGVYQTLTKQQEIIYNLNGKIKMLKLKLGIFDDIKKQNTNATIDSLSDSIISMSLVDQVQNEQCKLTEKKLKNLKNYLEGRDVVTIKPQRPQLPGLNSEIIIEKKIKAMKSLKKPEIKKHQDAKPQKPNQMSAIQPNIPSTVQGISLKHQQTESVFNLTQQSLKSSPFTAMPTATTSTQQPQTQASLTFGKKTEESQPQQQKAQTKPAFSFGQAPSQPFSLNLGGNASSMSQPSFTFASTSLVANADKKKEEAVVAKFLPQAEKQETGKPTKPPSTIANANISVSANFSLPLPPKTSPVCTQKELQKVEDKKADDAKVPTTNETTSFTFSLSSKGKESNSNKPTIAAVAPTDGISFGSLSSSSPTATSDTIKNAFSFGASQNSFSFASVGKPTETKTSTSAAGGSIFGGTASAPFSGFSLNLGDSNKSTTSTSSFGPLSAVKTTEETKTTSAAASSIPTSTTTASSFSFAGINAQTTLNDAKASTTFSFASAASSLVPSTSTISSAVTITAPSLFATNNAISTTNITTSITSTVSSSSTTTDSELSGLKICSPATVSSKPQTLQATPTGSIFSGSNASKSDSSSIFGSNSFNTAFNTSNATGKNPILGIAPSSAATTSPAISTTSTQSTTSSIFGAQTSTSTSSPGLFGSLSIDSSKTPASGIFGGSLVKPDQSVFGQVSTATSSTSDSIFGKSSTTPSIFGGQTATTTPSNIFGAAQPTSSSSTNIFAQATQVQQSSGGSIFGQTTTSNADSGSVFGSSSFAGPLSSTTSGGSIFGGTTATQSQSPFGSASVFGSGGQQSTQSSSIFGGNAFSGTQSPSTNIFGSASTGAVSPQATSPFGSGNIFTQQQQSPNQPVFGGNATFSNVFGQSSTTGSIFGQQQQSQPVFGGNATFGSPKASIFGSSTVSPQQSSGQANIFEQLGSQQSGNLFGSLATQQQQPPQQQAPGFSGSAFSSWR